jgi:hypothetical protein
MNKSLLRALSLTSDKTYISDNSSQVQREIEILNTVSSITEISSTISLIQKLADDHDKMVEQKEYLEFVQDIIAKEGLTYTISKFINLIRFVYAAESFGKMTRKLEKSSHRQFNKYQIDIVHEALEWSISKLTKNIAENVRIIILRISHFIVDSLKIFKRMQIVVQRTASRLQKMRRIHHESASKTVRIIEPERFDRIITTAFKNFELAERKASSAANDGQSNDTDDAVELNLECSNCKVNIVPDVSSKLLYLIKRADNVNLTISKLRQALSKLQQLSDADNDTDTNQEETIKEKCKFISDAIILSCRCVSLAMRQTFAVAHSFVVAGNAYADTYQQA